MRHAFGVILLFILGSAQAATISLNSTSRGWIDQNGDANGTSSGNNYLVGNCGSVGCSVGEYRDFFTFMLPTFTEDVLVLSATLIISTEAVDLNQSPELTVQFTSGSGSFGALGTGTVFGTKTYTIADRNTLVSIDLNQAATDAIMLASGGTFTVSGRVISPTTFSPIAPNQFVYGYSTSDAVTSLLINTVPIPAAVWLFGSGLGLLGWFRRKA
jgi:hypothetical protein